MASNFSEKAAFLWSVADLLRGDYKQADYGKVILPFTVLRRLDCVLEPTKNQVLKEYESRKNSGITDLSPFLLKVSGQKFYSVSRFNFSKLLDDPPQSEKVFQDRRQIHSRQSPHPCFLL